MFRKILIFIVIFGVGAGFGYSHIKTPQTSPIPAAKVGENTPKAFISEVYNLIQTNYWEKISDEDLLNRFSQALGKEIKTKKELLSEIKDSKVATSAASLVLASLKPAGRSGLYTEKQEVALKNLVENRNPETGKIEPTIFAKLIGNTLYIQFKKFSPTSLEEFQKAFDTYEQSSSSSKNSAVSSLVLDLRGNIGGAIDTTAYFLGFFMGKDQTAFEFYHQGQYLPFKTPTDKLSSLNKYKQIVVLIDQNTESSAELLAAALKKYHLGVVVGTPTKGWGTVERVFPLGNQINEGQKYSVFLVHSITLRDDNQPIEGRGVEPDINIKDANWKTKLFEYFRNPDLTLAVSRVI